MNLQRAWDQVDELRGYLVEMLGESSSWTPAATIS